MQIAAFGAGKAMFRPNLLRRIKSKRLDGGGCSLSRTRLPLEFPANREKYREFCPPVAQVARLSLFRSVVWRQKSVLAKNWNRDQTGNDQGTQFPVAEFEQPLCICHFARRRDKYAGSGHGGSCAPNERTFGP